MAKTQVQANIEINEAFDDPLSQFESNPVIAEVKKENKEILKLDSKEEEKIEQKEYWEEIKEKITLHSDKMIKEGENIELIEDSVENIKREIKVGEGRSRLHQLDKSEEKNSIEKLNITKEEYRKQMAILYEEMHNVI